MIVPIDLRQKQAALAMLDEVRKAIESDRLDRLSMDRTTDSTRRVNPTVVTYSFDVIPPQRHPRQRRGPGGL